MEDYSKVSEDEFSPENFDEIVKVPDSRGWACNKCYFLKKRCPDTDCVEKRFHYEIKKKV